jgi:hypothetical protein
MVICLQFVESGHKLAGENKLLSVNSDNDHSYQVLPQCFGAKMCIIDIDNTYTSDIINVDKASYIDTLSHVASKQHTRTTYRNTFNE